MPDITGLGSVADLATTVVNKIWPDKSQQEREQLAAAVTLVQGQIDVNKEEAKKEESIEDLLDPALVARYILGFQIKQHLLTNEYCCVYCEL